MADRFSRAMMEQVTGRPLSIARGRQSELDEAVSDPVQRDPDLEADLEAVRNGRRDPTPSPIPDAEDEWETNGPSTEPSSSPDPNAGSKATSEDVDETSDVSEKAKKAGEGDAAVETTDVSDATETGNIEHSSDSGTTAHDSNSPEKTIDSGNDRLVSRLRSEIDELEDRGTEMLRQYRDYGPATPQEIHTAAGGSGDRGPAYATNRTLRQRGLITHVGCGQYDYALATLVREELADPLRPEDPPSADTVADLVSAVETALLEEVSTAAGGRTAVAHSEKPTPKTTTEQ
jgi:hypothetical protein